MKIKKLALLVVLATFISLVTGCMHAEISFELNKDNTGKMTTLVAVDKQMVGEEVDISTSFATFENLDTTTQNITVNMEPIKYEVNGQTFEGNKATIAFNNSDQLLKSSGDDVKVSDLPNGNKKLEFYIPLQGTNEYLYMSNLFITTGGKIEFKIKTDYNVVNHNADKVVNGVYTWDLIKQAGKLGETDQKIYTFIEYTPENNNTNTGTEVTETVKKEKSLERTEIEKLLDTVGVNCEDKDFHGNALYQLGVLRGTDNGLELDKTLTRIEGVAVYARLLGLDDFIAQFAEENPTYDAGFTDVPNWAKNTVNALHSLNLVAGVGDNKFGSNDLMTETQYATLVLRALGYNDSKGDFTWNKADLKAREVGLYDSDNVKPDTILNKSFTRRGMSYISYNALFFNHKTTDEPLIYNIP